MTEADSVHSTPPTNTSPTRRNILSTIAAGGAIAALAISSSRANEPQAPSPIFAEASRAMAGVRERFSAAREATDEALNEVGAWERANPEPQSKRGRRRWNRRREALWLSPAATAAWQGQLEAENAFREAQATVAGLAVRNRADLVASIGWPLISDRSPNR
jgi:hypothetical protein